MESIYEESARIFKALGEPKRVMILDMLSCGELCACSILQKFQMSQPTLSHHMKILCLCGLVKSRGEGKWTYYSLNAEGIEKTKSILTSITTEKEDCICKEGCCSGQGCKPNE